MKKKIKKIIPIIFHVVIIGVLFDAFNKGYKSQAFYSMFILCVVNYLAEIVNNSFYLEMKKLVGQYSKTTDNLVASCQKYQAAIENKDKHFKELRTMYALVKGENLEIREMNNRLHEVNQAIVQGRK